MDQISNDFNHQVALAFLNDACESTHGNIRIDSVFISPSGEWRLGGLELFSSAKDEAAVLYVRTLER
jgi:SCY1-like protein 1